MHTMWLALFYVALGAMLYGVFWMVRMQNVLIQHRHDIVARLVEVTDALPADEREDGHVGNAQLLDAQLRELQAMRPWWRR